MYTAILLLLLLLYQLNLFDFQLAVDFLFCLVLIEVLKQVRKEFFFGAKVGCTLCFLLILLWEAHDYANVSTIGYVNYVVIHLSLDIELKVTIVLKGVWSMCKLVSILPLCHTSHNIFIQLQYVHSQLYQLHTVFEIENKNLSTHGCKLLLELKATGVILLRLGKLEATSHKLHIECNIIGCKLC